MSTGIAPAHSPKSPSATGTAPKILVVDDDRDLATALKLRLERVGFSVTCAYDGQAALEMALREKPDLVVLDVMMSYHDGFEVCTRLKANKRGYCPKVIIVSAVTQGTSYSADACQRASGADAFFSKPFEAKRLVEEIVKLLPA